MLHTVDSRSRAGEIHSQGRWLIGRMLLWFLHLISSRISGI